MQPTIYIPRKVYTKIMHWVNKKDLEVSGFGKCIYYKDDNYFIISDVVLLKQEVGAAHTDIDEVALGKAMFEAKDMPGDFNFWWHSHVKMNVFWSSQDKETINEIGKQGYCLATVFNQKNEMRTAIAYNATTPFGGTQLHFEDELETVVYDPPTTSEKEAWDKEFTEKVAERKWSAKDYSRGTWDPVTKTWIDEDEATPGKKFLGENENDSKSYENKNGSSNIIGLARGKGTNNQTVVKLRRKIEEFDYRHYDAEKILRRFESFRTSGQTVYIKQVAAILDMYCYEVDNGLDGLTDDEHMDLENIVSAVAMEYPQELQWN